MDADELESIADEVYASAFDAFTESRNALASAAKKRGDADLAAAVRALRKPTAAAHAVNLLIRSRPAALSELSAVRARIEEATDRGDRDELRAASRDRHELVARLVDAARAAVSETGGTVSGPAADEIADAFVAAIGDAAIAAAIATGRSMATPLSGGMSRSDIRALVALPPDDLAHGTGDDEDGEGDDEDDTASDATRSRRGGRGASAAGTRRAGSDDPGSARMTDRAASLRRRRERELAAAEEAHGDARADRERREGERDRLAAERDERRDDVRRQREALRLAEKVLGDLDDRLDAFTADIRSRELDWKRAEASVRRARRALDEVDEVDVEDETDR